MEDSVETYLGKLETEELERVADRLLELTEMPGWADLETLAGVYRDKAISQMIVTPSDRATSYAHTSGRILGVERFMGLAEKVAETRRRVRVALENGRQ